MARTISKVGLQSSGFCPICLRKLQVSVGYKIAERYKALMQWMEEDQRSMVRPLSLGLPSPVPNPLKPFMLYTLAPLRPGRTGEKKNYGVFQWIWKQWRGQ